MAFLAGYSRFPGRGKAALLALLLCLSSACAARESIEEITVVCEEWAGFTNSDGSGAYWEIVRAIYEPEGIKVKSKTMPWKRAEEFVRSKAGDALVGAYFDPSQDNAEFQYPKWHISVEDPVVVIFKKSRLPLWSAEGMQFLAGKRVAWIRGYNFDKEGWLNAPVEVFEISTVVQGLRLLEIDRVAGLLDYSINIRAAAAQAEIQLDDYSMQVANPGKKLYVKFSNTSRSKKLIKIFDSRMSELAANGTITAIYRRWGYDANKFGRY
ncbi:hypothetical protein BTA51_01070 [Hahella sp. CCB-MM4]|uniref:substrate-binding periplasmic protein n=1 Tax=Hahella sp. (strain CCB-MM4) TaxID=1926491 RepID=UPI000B9BD921|nr:transporter substrate-binding domain-containing protein [Hahella sp. CCB-MM4]OZG75023.1 hypothetical protein BTA51_01070 [Hahella sp. CCB-MM4]